MLYYVFYTRTASVLVLLFVLELRILITGSRASREGSFRPYILYICAEYEKSTFLFRLDEIDLIGFQEGSDRFLLESLQVLIVKNYWITSWSFGE